MHTGRHGIRVPTWPLRIVHVPSWEGLGRLILIVIVDEDVTSYISINTYLTILGV